MKNARKYDKHLGPPAKGRRVGWEYQRRITMTEATRAVQLYLVAYNGMIHSILDIFGQGVMRDGCTKTETGLNQAQQSPAPIETDFQASWAKVAQAHSQAS